MAFRNSSIPKERLELYRSIQGMMLSWEERFWSILFNDTDYEFLKWNKTILVERADVLSEKFMFLTERVHLEMPDTGVMLNLGSDKEFKAKR